jgi:FMN phosphatase YigB (HAD superfamily)
MGPATGAVPTSVRFVKRAIPQIYSFDALGTLYDFKEPVVTQYRKIAEGCGVPKVKAESLDQAFRSAYKRTNKELPNYGKHHGIESPAVWWDLLVHRTFSQVVPVSSIPESLGARMYLHFASASAYTLRPDARQTLAHFKAIRNRKMICHSDDNLERLILICVISNSDPRVIDILRDLGLKVGTVRPAGIGAHDFDPTDYNPDNDIDFVCTSYEADSEKPDRAIFDYARRLAAPVIGAHALQRAQALRQGAPDSADAKAEELAVGLNDPDYLPQEHWIHVGNEFDKDTVGAAGAGLTPLHLCVDGRSHEWIEPADTHGTAVIRDLTEVQRYRVDKITS